MLKDIQFKYNCTNHRNKNLLGFGNAVDETDR